MKWWVYKCNNKNNPYSNTWSDWRQFFDGERPPSGRWGLTSVCRDLVHLQPGDMVLAYQTDRNELVGVARMMRFEGEEVHLEPVTRFVGAIKMRNLKKLSPEVARIPAFQQPQTPAEIMTLYWISENDAKRLIEIARGQEGKSTLWTTKTVWVVYDQDRVPVAAFEIEQRAQAGELVLKRTKEQGGMHYVQEGEHLILSEDPSRGRLTAEQRAELARRDAELDANPGIALSWEQIRASIEAKP